MARIHVSTAAQAQQEITRLRERDPLNMSPRQIQLWNAHLDRLALIHAPLPVVRRLGTGSALPWGGCIVADTFGEMVPQRANKAWRSQGNTDLMTASVYGHGYVDDGE